MLPIAHFEKQSLIDYPGKVSAIIFLKGCNFHCSYCHNPELAKPLSKVFSERNNVISRGEGVRKILSEESVLNELRKRKNFLDGVVITGGEPTLYKALLPFLARIKEIGLSIKLDTNESRPELLKEIIMFNLVDYIAMDIKDSLENYKRFTNEKDIAEKLSASIKMIQESQIKYEFRTTVVESELSQSNIIDITKIISAKKEKSFKYYLQKFYPSKTYNDDYKNLSPTPHQFLFDLKEVVSDRVCCEIRGV